MFVFDMGDVIVIAMFIISLLMVIVYIALSLIKQMGEKVINKISSREGYEDNSEQDS